MNIFVAIQDKWNAMAEKSKPAREKCGKKCKTVKKKLHKFFSTVYRFRGVILASIVVLFSIVLAIMSGSMLPDQVGIDLQSDGSFSMMVPKLVAILFPMLITLVSLLFVLVSKRTLYPFLISMFTLTIPMLILLTNVFPY